MEELEGGNGETRLDALFSILVNYCSVGKSGFNVTALERELHIRASKQ